MKEQLWKYRRFWLMVVAIVLIVALSILSGTGYAMVVWLGWQFQTTATLLLLLVVAIMSCLLLVVRLVNRWVKNWYVRHPRHIHVYQQLLPFEQLGCLWLLNAKTTKQHDLEKIFNQSASLKQLINAHLLRENGQYEQAWQVLEHGSSLTELLMLEKAELYIAQQHHQEALNQLLLIAHQPESTLVQSLNPAWQQHVQHLWASLAQAAPWLVLAVPERPHFNTEQKIAWLHSLEQQIGQSTPVDRINLIAVYEQQPAEIMDNFLMAKQWLLLLSVLPSAELEELVNRRLSLADTLLKRQFDPVILAIWLQDQRQQENLDSTEVIERLELLAQRYPGQPSIALAQWHQLKACQQHDAAQIILQAWQQHPDFSYIRLSDALADQPALLADLEVIYQHVKF